MTIRQRIVELISIPYNNKKIDETCVSDLKTLLHDFVFSTNDNCYNFVYDNIYVVISDRGTIIISLVSKDDLGQSVCLLSKFTDRINSIMSIDDSVIKIRSVDLN